MGQFNFEVAIKNATALGYCNAARELLSELTFDYLEGELEDDEYVRFETARESGAGEDV